MQVWMVAGLGVSQVLGWGATFYMPAVLGHPIAADTGWSMAEVVAGLSLGLLIAGLCSPYVGRHIERQGGRSVMVASSVLLPLGLLLISLSHNLWAYYASWLIMGVGMAAGLYDAAFATMGRLYGKDARAYISGLTLMGGFSSTLCWPALAAAEHLMGWRHTLQCMAALYLLVCLPLHLYLIPKQVPHTHGAQAKSVSTTTSNLEATRPTAAVNARLLFGMVCAIFTLQAMVTSSMAVHLIGALQQLGLTTATALAVGVLLGPAQIASRLIEIAFGSKVHPTLTFRITATCVFLGVSLMSLGHPELAFAAMLLYGGGNGILTIVKGTLPLALFGAQGYATRMGLMARPVMAAHACGPVLGALVLDQWGGAVLLWSLAGVLLLVVAGGWLLPTHDSSEP